MQKDPVGNSSSNILWMKLEFTIFTSKLTFSPCILILATCIQKYDFNQTYRVCEQLKITKIKIKITRWKPFSAYKGEPFTAKW